MRTLAIGLAVGVLVFVITGGHFFFLPLLLIPFGLFRFGGPRHKRDDLRLRSPLQPVKRARPRHRAECLRVRVRRLEGDRSRVLSSSRLQFGCNEHTGAPWLRRGRFSG